MFALSVELEKTYGVTTVAHNVRLQAIAFVIRIAKHSRRDMAIKSLFINKIIHVLVGGVGTFEALPRLYASENV